MPRFLCHAKFGVQFHGRDDACCTHADRRSPNRHTNCRANSDYRAVAHADPHSARRGPGLPPVGDCSRRQFR
ncbi:MAG TPA: hypothetical protein ENN99_01110, partial [Chloroflexi bacterium]|nr:hypothetical protein [Chloroflexota bacterium]